MNKLIILAYHGVTDKKEFNGIENYNGLHILKKDFIKQMKFIKSKCNICSMDQVVKFYNNKKYPKNIVMVTFDDGYKNNYLVACPILNKLKIPATFYITTGSKLMETRILYTDFIEKCINYSILGDIRKIKMIGIYKKKIKAVHAKSDAVYILYQLLNKLNLQRDKILETSNKDYHLVSKKDVIDMDRNKLFTIGSHSYSHLNLAALNYNEMKDDIVKSLLLLSSALNKKIKYFSYPSSKCSEAVIGELKRNGIISSPLAYPGSNTVKTDLFHLKRITVGYNKRPFPYKELLGE